MQTKKILIYQVACILLLVLAITLLWKNKNVEMQQPVLSKQEAVLQTIHERKSVRNFIPQKMVSKDDLETLVKAGMAAPSAVNKQPWAFVVITERMILDSLSELAPYAQMLADAGAAIVVCGNMNKVLEGVGHEFWVQDCSAATENILLAVESMGLGAVWTGLYPNKFDNLEKIYTLLNTPKNMVLLNIIAIGYPTGEDQPKDKWEEENLIWEKFDN